MLSDVQDPGGAGETDGMNELSEVVEAGDDSDRMEMLSDVQDPGGAGETDGMNELSEVVEAGDDSDRMEMLSDVQDPGGTGETDGIDEFSEIEDDGSESAGEKVRLDELLVIGDAGDKLGKLPKALMQGGILPVNPSSGSSRRIG